jgi:hypothetical protein
VAFLVSLDPAQFAIVCQIVELTIVEFEGREGESSSRESKDGQHLLEAASKLAAPNADFGGCSKVLC